jgi:hypothetical protein
MEASMSMFKPKKNDESKVFQYGFVAGKKVERERIREWLHVESGHNGQTHWEGKDCFWCRAIRFIQEDEA